MSSAPALATMPAPASAGESAATAVAASTADGDDEWRREGSIYLGEEIIRCGGALVGYRLP